MCKHKKGYKVLRSWHIMLDKKCGESVECYKYSKGLRIKIGVFFDDVIDPDLKDIRLGKGLSRADVHSVESPGIYRIKEN